jgi:hypothetical protein
VPAPPTITYSEAAETGFLAQGSYSSALSSGKWSDVTIIGPDIVAHKAHKIILCTHSGFFDTALAAEGFSETKNGTISIRFPDPWHVWPAVLEYIYSGKISISQNFVAVYAMANQLDIARLKKHCENYLKTIVKAENCLELLAKALEFPEGGPLIEIVVENVAKHFGSLLWNADYNGFPVWVMEALLAREDLYVRYEFQVLFCAVKYAEAIKAKEGGGSESMLEGIPELCRHVRLEFLPNHILVACDAFDYIPRDLLLRGTLDRLGTLSSSPSSTPRQHRRAPRISYTCESSDLASLKEHVTLSSSGIQHGELSNVIGKGLCITTAIPNCWVGIELPFPVKITSYSFNSEGACNRAAGRMKNWLLEGAIDKAGSWSPLHIRHGEAVNVFSTALDSGPASVPVRFVRIRGPVQQEAGYGIAITEWNLGVVTPEETAFGGWSLRQRSKEAASKD